ncbi:hypothetical protein, partial [Leisingera sp. F5]|uniref:hypothetical protein n=1 Tax=Leisingera sp. F5 TaxID=1813816 RepID=UPI0025C149F1
APVRQRCADGLAMLVEVSGHGGILFHSNIAAACTTVLRRFATLPDRKKRPDSGNMTRPIPPVPDPGQLP